MTLVWFSAYNNANIIFEKKKKRWSSSHHLQPSRWFTAAAAATAISKVVWNQSFRASLRYPSLCYRLPGEPDCLQVSWSAGLLVWVRGEIIQTWQKCHTFPWLLSPQWDAVWTRSWITRSNFSCASASDVLQIQNWRCCSTCCFYFSIPSAACN